jgi:hypothetical protein
VSPIEAEEFQAINARGSADERDRRGLVGTASLISLHASVRIEDSDAKSKVSRFDEEPKITRSGNFDGKRQDFAIRQIALDAPIDCEFPLR